MGELKREQIENARLHFHEQWPEAKIDMDALCDLALRGLDAQRADRQGLPEPHTLMDERLDKEYGPCKAPASDPAATIAAPESYPPTVSDNLARSHVVPSDPVVPTAVKEVEAQAFDTPLHNSPIPGTLLKVVPKSLALSLARRLDSLQRKLNEKDAKYG